MTVYLSNRDGNGKTNEEGHYRLQTKILTGQVLGANALKVTQNSPLGMSVLVGAGDYRLETTGGWAYTGWLDTDSTVSINTADPANARITTIIAYVDKNAATSASPPNNPGVTKLLAVDGTASGTPVAPTGSALQAAAGAGNPYMALADITVDATVTQIANAKITDRRTQITIAPDVLNSTGAGAVIGNLMYPVGSIYTNASVATNPATLLGFGTWSAFGTGRVLVGVSPGETEFDALGETGGAKTHTLTVNEMPDHRHSKGHVNFSAGPGPVSPNSSWAGILQNSSWGINMPDFGATDGGYPQTGPRGGGQPHNNLQPYVTVYMWRRVS